jgi:hypothetical protein
MIILASGPFSGQPQYQWVVQQSRFKHQLLVVEREWNECLETEPEREQRNCEPEQQR